MNCISFTSYKGNFNWLDSKQSDWQYIINYGKFSDKANELKLKKSFLVSTDYDCGHDFEDCSVLELCRDIKRIYNEEYSWHSAKKDIDDIISFLESVEHENDMLFCVDMIEKLNKEVTEKQVLIYKYESRLHDLMDN